MPRNCFVIMPFSTTTSCTEDEWTKVFEEVFRPVVENSGLDYICTRSAATRGNIVAAILQELEDAYVVLADLTDRNANVFYELGVRHTIKDRTILLAQKREDIPSDLQAYAYHIYDWRTANGRDELAKRLKELLAEVDARPDKPDNPVSDFLGTKLKKQDTEPTEVTTSEEVRYAQPLVGKASEGLNIVTFVSRLSLSSRPQAIQTVIRLTRAELLPVMQQMIGKLNKQELAESIQEKDILDIANKYIGEVDPLTSNIESFVLNSIDEDWSPGINLGLFFAGEWISLSNKPSPGRDIKFARGIPQFLALRILILMGSKALDNEAFNLLGMIIKKPIESEENTGLFTNRPLIERRDLFWPEAFLGYADKPIRYFVNLWKNKKQLHDYFITEEDYHLAIGKFLMLICLTSSTPETRPFYPGYRLVPHAKGAMSSLCSKLLASNDYLKGIANSIGESPEEFIRLWPERTAVANKAGLGGGYFSDGPQFPTKWGDQVTD